jgi:hypothetical protein
MSSAKVGECGLLHGVLLSSRVPFRLVVLVR